MGLPEFLPLDSPLRYACLCGHRAEYARARLVEYLYYDDSTKSFTVTCPECDCVRPAKVLNGTFPDGTMTAVSTGEFSDNRDRAPNQAHASLAEVTDFEDSLSPVLMVEGAFIITCTECDELLTEDNYNADGSAPEVGWEYYECPMCGDRTRTDVAEHRVET